jgi:hypothetical protein
MVTRTTVGWTPQLGHGAATVTVPTASPVRRKASCIAAVKRFLASAHS